MSGKDFFILLSSLLMAAALIIFLFAMLMAAIAYFGTTMGCYALLVLVLAAVLAKGHLRVGDYTL